MISGRPGQKTKQGAGSPLVFHRRLKMMKNLFLYLLLFSVAWVAEASETTFAYIQKRITKRDDLMIPHES
jgi:hypothetical protein